MALWEINSKKKKKTQRKGITGRKGGKGKDRGRLIENQTETDSERKEIETCRKKQTNKQTVHMILRGSFSLSQGICKSNGPTGVIIIISPGENWS